GGVYGTITNNSTIIANQTSVLDVSITRNNGTIKSIAGGTLVIDPLQTNAGIVEASGGTVEVTGALTQTNHGLVEALNNSVVELMLNPGGSYGTITGGTLTAETGGAIETGVLQIGGLTNVTIAAGTTFT